MSDTTFIEREVTVGQGEWKLPGTLTLPENATAVPGLILVHGSGPNDRDETIGRNKVFRDLAWGLAERGVAVLRYEKRSRHYRHRFIQDMASFQITVKEESVDDAVAAFHSLSGIPEIDSTRRFILGHSLGGMLIPRIGGHTPECAGYIVLAGLTRPIADTMLEQVRYILCLAEKAGQTVDQKTADWLADFEKKVACASSPGLTLETSRDDLPNRIPPSYWLDLRGYEPHIEVRQLNKPVLVMHAERDYQVTAEDFDNWKTGLSESESATFRSYPSLNHLLIAGSGLSHPGEYQIPGKVDEAVIVDIAEWITAHHP